MSIRLSARLAWAILLICCVLCLPTTKVHAYLDPGSGSFVLQVLVASILGALVSLRLFWGRIIGLFKKGGREPTTLGSSTHPPEELTDER